MVPKGGVSRREREGGGKLDRGNRVKKKKYIYIYTKKKGKEIRPLSSTCFQEEEAKSEIE